ncbi:MAG: fumarylacetoacetate hydrolase family protein [Gammaproteobacteria bacterium]
MFQIVSFDAGKGPVVGLRDGDNYYPSETFTSVREMVDQWPLVNEKLGTAAARIADRTPLTDVTLLPPLADPRNIYITGANYTDHIEEMSRALGVQLVEDARNKGFPPWFVPKSASSVVGPDAVVNIPDGVKALDWELELAVIIGRQGKNIAAADALDYVAGYTVANDLSARDRMARDYEAADSALRLDWLRHKSFDGSCPLGPAITPATLVADVQNLAIKLWVNDELMQDSHTSRMIYSVADLVAGLSEQITIHPGDVILTGTPAGVGSAQQRFLQSGDRVRQQIEQIGEFEFTVL